MKKVLIVILIFLSIFNKYTAFADTSSQDLYSIRVGYYKDNKQAQTLLKNIKKQGFPVYKVTKKGTYYIFVGDFRSYEKAQNAKTKLKNSGFDAQLYTKSPKTKEFQKLPTENSKKAKSNPKPKQKPKSKPSKPKTTSTISLNTKPQTSKNDIINVKTPLENLKEPKEELSIGNNKTLIVFLMISSTILFLGVKSILT